MLINSVFLFVSWKQLGKTKACMVETLHGTVWCYFEQSLLVWLGFFWVMGDLFALSWFPALSWSSKEGMLIFRDFLLPSSLFWKKKYQNFHILASITETLQFSQHPPNILQHLDWQAKNPVNGTSTWCILVSVYIDVGTEIDSFFSQRIMMTLTSRTSVSSTCGTPSSCSPTRTAADFCALSPAGAGYRLRWSSRQGKGEAAWDFVFFLSYFILIKTHKRLKWTLFILIRTLTKQFFIFLFFYFLFRHFIIPFGKFGPPYLGQATASRKSSATLSYKCVLGLFVFL